MQCEDKPDESVKFDSVFISDTKVNFLTLLLLLASSTVIYCKRSYFHVLIIRKIIIMVQWQYLKTKKFLLINSHLVDHPSIANFHSKLPLLYSRRNKLLFRTFVHPKGFHKISVRRSKFICISRIL